MKNQTVRQLLLPVLFLWIAAFAAYSNSFTIAFQFDDLHTIQSNIAIRTLTNIPRFFVDANTYSYRPENSGYRPMTTTFAALGFSLSQMETWGYHLIKLAEHCLLATLLFFIGLRFLPVGESVSKERRVIAWLASLVFVAHRINTEVVDYLSAASSLQAALFLFSGFALYLRARQEQVKRKRRAYFAGSLVAYLAGMLSKEEAITLPAVIAAYEWIYVYAVTAKGAFVTRVREITKRVLPYLAVAVLYVALRTHFQLPAADLSRGQASPWLYFITQLRSWLYYWFQYFWPVNLNADNLAFDFSTGLDDWRVWGALAVHALIIGSAWRFWKRDRRSPKTRFVFFAVVWMYVTVLPASSVFVLVEAVNEHRAYIPYLFLSLLSVWGVFELASRVKVPFRATIGGVLCVAVALGAGAFDRNKVWQTDISLWQDVYDKNPESVRAMNILGVSLLNRGEFARATAFLEACHEKNPSYLPCIVHLSMAYGFAKRFDEGLALLLKGHQIDPFYVHVNYHLGVYYKEHFADFKNARAHLERAERESGGRFFQATIKLAEMELEEGHIQNAIECANRILDADRSNGDAWEIYAKAKLITGQLPEAAQIFEKLFAVAPLSYRYALNVANVAERQGTLDRALEHYKRVTELMPEAIQAWTGLVRVAKKRGMTELERAATAHAEALVRSKGWFFIASSFLPGESTKQISP